MQLIKDGKTDAVRDEFERNPASAAAYDDATGQTPLMAAAQANHFAIVQLVLKHDVDVNLASKEHGTCNGYTAVHFAARNGNTDMLDVLHSKGANINRPSTDGWCPIHVAAFAHKSQMLQRLVAHGADVDAKNDQGLPAIVFVANHGSASDTRFLLKKGASVKFVDANGDSVLHHALHTRVSQLFEGEYDVPSVALDVTIVLVLHGVDVDHKNKDGETAWKYMAEGIPALPDLLHVIAHNKLPLLASGVEWNFMTFKAVAVEKLIAMGIDANHARDIVTFANKSDEQRVAWEKEREAERPAGGCPVMRGKKNKNKKPEVPADGSDPSNGACPFFNKDKKDDDAAKPPAGHPAMDAKDVPPGTDPSNGACPFFKGKAPAPAPTAAAASAAPSPSTEAPKAAVSSPAQHGSVVKHDAAPALNWQLIYEHRTVILLMVVSFLLGSAFEQRFGAAR